MVVPAGSAMMELCCTELLQLQQSQAGRLIRFFRYQGRFDLKMPLDYLLACSDQICFDAIRVNVMHMKLGAVSQCKGIR